MQAELHVQVRIKETEMRKAQHDLKHVAKARDGVVKRHRKRENVVRVLAGALPGLQAQKEALEHEVECAAATTRRQGEARFRRRRLPHAICVAQPASGTNTTTMAVPGPARDAAPLLWCRSCGRSRRR